MDNRIYDSHLFTRTTPEGIWDNNYYNNSVPPYGGILAEPSILAQTGAASMPAAPEPNFSPAASVFSCADPAEMLSRISSMELLHGDFRPLIAGSGLLEGSLVPGVGCNNNHFNESNCSLWNVGCLQHEFPGNFLRYGDCNSQENCQSTMAITGEFKAHFEGPGDKFAAEFQANVWGSTTLNRETGDITYETALNGNGRAVAPLGNIRSLNELELVYKNINASPTNQYSNLIAHEIASMENSDGEAGYSCKNAYVAGNFNQCEEAKSRMSNLISPSLSDYGGAGLNASYPSPEADLDPSNFKFDGNIHGTESVRPAPDHELPLGTFNKKIPEHGDPRSPEKFLSISVKEMTDCHHSGMGIKYIAGNREINGAASDRIKINHTDAAPHGPLQNPSCGAGGPAFDSAKVESGGVNKNKGRPAKNLMAERRRRKRLNERLCMLRSVVPRISKMDRTSILSDTIEYMKELLQRIRYLHHELQVPLSDSCPALINAQCPDHHFKNVTKFEVKRANGCNLNVHMSCPANPGLLLSTVNTLESFGIDIQQGIISCFNDFGMQACCLERDKNRSFRTEDVKLALLQNAGYLGKTE